MRRVENHMEETIETKSTLGVFRGLKGLRVMWTLQDPETEMGYRGFSKP